MTTTQMDAADADRPTLADPAPTATAHIFSAIREVMAAVRGVAKAGEMKSNPNSRQVQYTFQKYDDMAEAIGKAFRDQGVMTQVQVINCGRDSWDKPTQTGSTRWTSAWVHMAFHFTSLVDGTTVEVQALGEGADSSDKATNKAQTAAYKNALKIALTLSTSEDDPDASRPEIPGGQGAQVRNDPWRVAEDAVRAATADEVAGKPPKEFGDDQREKVNKLAAGVGQASMEDLDKALAWATKWNLLECPVPNGGTLAGLLLTARGMLTGAPR